MIYTWIGLAALLLCNFCAPIHAFSSSGRGRGFRGGGGDNGRARCRPNDNGGPPAASILLVFGRDDDREPSEAPEDDPSFPRLLASATTTNRGSKSTASSQPKSSRKNKIHEIRQNISQSLEDAQRRVLSIFKSKERREEEALMATLRKTPIRAVTAPNSTVLPEDVITTAAKRSGMIGSPLCIETLQEMARNLKHWYERKGYILHAVTGATLQPDTATAELTVQEPTVSVQPVGITFCKEMIIDDDGSLLTYRQYCEKHASSRKPFGHDRIDKSKLNSTYVQTTGRTNPQRLAQVLKMNPGKPFEWDGNRWRAIAGSGIFSRVLRASPEPMRDGTVQLHVLATEAPPRNLEYGISKSLYTGSWEGELDFEHNNLFGGGESVELVVRRGTKDAEPSVRLQFRDDKFGLGGGYDVELFSDFIGDSREGGEDVEVNGIKREEGDLLDRRGASVRLRNPFSPRWVPQSSASACVERTSTVSGRHEAIASTTFGVGPLRIDLPSDARSNLSLKLTTGTRVREDRKVEDSSGIGGYRVKPYSSATATTCQVFPLTKLSGNKRPVTLALQHSMTASTFNLPRHEMNALGHASTLRGYSSRSNGGISACVGGTTEVRIPVTLPTDKVQQDASVVIYGDWLFAKRKPNSSLFRKSSVGIGLRKGLQGIPVKYDVSITEDGKIGATFWLGRDFDA